VFFMVLETWCVPLATGGSSDAMSDFAMLRMLRLLRLTRMVRLMRSVPELVTLVRGMRIALRSVSSILMLVLIFMYIFAIIFKSQLAETKVPKLKSYFSGIPTAMWTLLLHGCLLDDIFKVSNLLVKEGVFITSLFIFFVLLSSLMLLNMLIGVLCAVVTAVAAAEKEKALVTFVKATLIKVLEDLDEDKNGTISKAEFLKLVDVPDAIHALDELDIDIPNLVSLADTLFSKDDEEDDLAKKKRKRASATADQDMSHDNFKKKMATTTCLDLDEISNGSGEIEMKFEDFLKMVLRLRGSLKPSVADIVDMRKLVQKNQKVVHRRLGLVQKHQAELQEGVSTICEQLLTLCLKLETIDKLPKAQQQVAREQPITLERLNSKEQSFVQRFDSLIEQGQSKYRGGPPEVKLSSSEQPARHEL